MGVTEKVIFKADDKFFEWEIDYFGDRQSQVIRGGIAEWYRTVDILNNKLIEQMDILAHSETAKIRFQGKGYRDHTLTEKEKNDLRNFLKLYQYYENY